MKKKILIFSLAYFPKHIGGAEVAIKEIVERLPADKYEFHMVCNRYDSTLLPVEMVGSVKVHRIGFTTKEPTMADLRKMPLHLNKILYQWQALWMAKKLHKTEKYDGIWAMMAHSTGVPAGQFKKAFPDVKYLLTLQEGDPSREIEKKMKIFGKAFDDAFLKADLIQVISGYLGSWARERGFKGEVVMVPNAVNTAHFTQDFSEQELKEVRAELGLVESDVALVTTSRLVEKNAVDDVIRAIKFLPEKVKFIVFGTGPDEIKLRDLITKTGVSDRVQLRGQIGHAEMPKYLKACDIFIRPSRSEGMGNSFVEAMAAELPVIATQEGGIADFLFDEVKNSDKETTGWAVSADSPEEIKSAVEDIINRPEKVREVTVRAKEMAIEKYDWNLIATRMDEEVFETLFSDS